jgi:putative DNA primase/helicase
MSMSLRSNSPSKTMPARRRAPKLSVVEIGDDGVRPIVRIVAGQRTRAIDKAEDHLAAGDPDLFQRGEFIVRVAPEDVDVGGGEKASALRIVTVGTQHMRERFTRVADLQRYDSRAKKWFSTDCPKDFAEAYLERIYSWKLRVLRAVTTTPFLRPDGAIVERPGYDPLTGIFYDPRGTQFGAVPSSPTRGEALAALDRLDCLFATLDIVDDVSRSVALSALMTPTLRSAMCASPMHGISAPSAGSGKSKVVNIAATIATGHCAPVTALGKNEEETEKRLVAVMFAGDAICNLDNAGRSVGGDFLCQVITEPLVAPRILGVSRRLIVPNTTSWYSTGNNLTFVGDMVRRALLCRLDPHCERPELREFETADPCQIALENRPALVVDVLTIARAFAIAGRPREVPPLGSFGDWSTWVRDPLIWLGRADPVASMSAIRQEDPKAAALVAVLEAWSALFGGRVTARELVEKGSEKGPVSGECSNADLRDALLSVAGEGTNISARRLGAWLGSVKGRTVNGKRIEAAETVRGVGGWQLFVEIGG